MLPVCSSFFDLSRSANLHDQAEQSNCFYIPSAIAEPLRYQGKVVGDMREGNSVNCELVSICPHGSCTHTECIGHITPEKTCVMPPAPLLSAVLVSVETVSPSFSQDSYPADQSDSDKIVCSEKLRAMIEPTLPKNGKIDAIIIRTEVGSACRTINFSGTNPPYVTPNAMEYLVSVGCKHLLVDLPSVDREEDQGYLSAHSVFFGIPPRSKDSNSKIIPRSSIEVEAQRIGATITELCYISQEVPDGHYILNLQVSPLLLDAIPSRPILFPISTK